MTRYYIRSINGDIAFIKLRGIHLGHLITDEGHGWNEVNAFEYYSIRLSNRISEIWKNLF